ncbi:HutD family protein [Acidocella sp.]|uniref:HutD/Ves family protein n=1 Tax=Acidocella sp. TaxID=50710 RepID=UPI0018572C85|nr:HutD family protein [Acidocella sp.]NNM57702.1 HutD family protein [Acidocella sp.]
MLIIESAGYRQMPWKNGAGTTTEIAVSPSGATTDDFDWRISMAQVGSDGWFSEFPGIDRTLAVLVGNGLDLSIAAAPPVRILPASAPCRFAADIPVFAKLFEGPIIDLNVMTRRNRFTHQVIRLEADAPIKWQLQAEVTVVLSCTSALHIDDGAHSARLHANDSAFFQNQGNPLIVIPENRATIYFIELSRI